MFGRTDEDRVKEIGPPEDIFDGGIGIGVGVEVEIGDDEEIGTGEEISDEPTDPEESCLLTSSIIETGCGFGDVPLIVDIEVFGSDPDFNGIGDLGELGACSELLLKDILDKLSLKFGVFDSVGDSLTGLVDGVVNFTEVELIPGRLTVRPFPSTLFVPEIGISVGIDPTVPKLRRFLMAEDIFYQGKCFPN